MLGLLAAVVVAANAVGVPPPAAALASASAAVPPATLTGEALSGAIPLASTQVTLYRTRLTGTGPPIVLGVSQTRPDGSFVISYPAQRRSAAVLYVIAGRGSAVRLAAVLGTAASLPGRAVVDERTTVAAGVALAEFITDRAVAGRFPGPQNAAAMAGNLADARTGGLSRVLATAPNGNQTSTLRTVNSLANMLVPCVRSASRCAGLFRLATPPGGRAPQGILAAVADVTRNPGHNVRGLFALARSGPAPYQPALGASQRPDAWTVASGSWRRPAWRVLCRFRLSFRAGIPASSLACCPSCGPVAPAGGCAVSSPFRTRHGAVFSWVIWQVFRFHHATVTNRRRLAAASE